MELCVTQYWTELHPLTVSFRVVYHSLRPSCNNFILVRHIVLLCPLFASLSLSLPLFSSTPVLHGGGLMCPVAMDWRTCIQSLN